MAIKIELDEDDLSILDKALVQLPYYEVFELIDKINRQIFEQKPVENS